MDGWFGWIFLGFGLGGYYCVCDSVEVGIDVEMEGGGGQCLIIIIHTRSGVYMMAGSDPLDDEF